LKYQYVKQTFLTVDECSEENAANEKSGIPQKRKRGRPRKEQGDFNLI
jgi:hypothetical protein